MLKIWVGAEAPPTHRAVCTTCMDAGTQRSTDAGMSCTRKYRRAPRRAQSRNVHAAPTCEPPACSELRRRRRSRLHGLDVLDVGGREVPCRAAAGNATENDAVQERVPAQAVVAVDSARGLSGGVEAANHLAARTQGLRLVVDAHPAHAIVDDGRHDGHVERVAGLQGKVVEELLAPLVPGLAAPVGLVGPALRVPLLLLRDLVVVLECGLDVGKRDAVLLCELAHVGVGLHDATALIVLAMPSDLSGCLAVQAQEEPGRAAECHPLVLPHHAGHVVTAAQLVAEAVPLHVQEHTADAAQGLGGQELHLGVGVLGVHQARGVHLDPLEVHALPADGHGHLEAVARAMVAVGRRQVRQVGPVLVQQGVRREVGPEAARRDDDRAVLLEGLPVVGDALAAADVAVAVGQEPRHLGLQQDPGAVGALCDLLQLLHEAVCDGHAGEPLLAAVRPGHRVAPEAGHQAQVHAKLVDDPVHGGGAFVAQHVHQVRAARASAHRVLDEDLWTVLDLVLALRLREGPVYPARRLSAVAAEEGVLVDHTNLDAVLHDSVRGREASQPPANDDDLLHRGCPLDVYNGRKGFACKAPWAK
eukprot:CAMPEP_0204531988 /NCGR_PEP_ID=MMETSP0661-20131031/11472_1 /ASSEMBLY_ACC=CAM_ASM_000606 /TAXON_ID=109239 /ORGANISM="Alexandrium margalefi, Strain AMGDE01CS-322" /LENGTH=587 /DNA_ID=CAMNT_0051538187 /DNA_START=230 /DNA_END=1990 /DNA_ORIENTATION=+